MKIARQITIVLAVLLLAAGFINAADYATRDECVAKIGEVSALVEKEGVEMALQKINEKEGAFVWKDTYVFALDAETAAVIAHPIKPKLIGKKMTGLKDTNGKLFFTEFINLANEKGKGWVDYMWPKPGEKKPSSKSTYIYKVPGKSVILAAGVYN